MYIIIWVETLNLQWKHSTKHHSITLQTWSQQYKWNSRVFFCVSHQVLYHQNSNMQFLWHFHNGKIDPISRFAICLIRTLGFLSIALDFTTQLSDMQSCPSSLTNLYVTPLVFHYALLVLLGWGMHCQQVVLWMFAEGLLDCWLFRVVCCQLSILSKSIEMEVSLLCLTFHHVQYFPLAFPARYVTRASLHGPLASTLHVCRLCYNFGFWR